MTVGGEMACARRDRRRVGMRRLVYATAMAAGLLPAAPVVASEKTGPSGAALVIRFYDATASSHSDLAAAVAAADAILRRAGIDARWVACAGADEHTGNPACAASLAPTELVVRIVRVAVPEHNWGSLPMGDSLVDTHERAGVLATIYLDRVAWVAAACGVDPLQLTGRAMAHEIGHLLLGTAAHERAGLMRALWSRDEMQRPVAANWQFTRSDATKLRRAIEGRLKRTPGAGTAD